MTYEDWLEKAAKLLNEARLEEFGSGSELDEDEVSELEGMFEAWKMGLTPETAVDEFLQGPEY